MNFTAKIKFVVCTYIFLNNKSHLYVKFETQNFLHPVYTT